MEGSVTRVGCVIRAVILTGFKITPVRIGALTLPGAMHGGVVAVSAVIAGRWTGAWRMGAWRHPGRGPGTGLRSLLTARLACRRARTVGPGSRVIGG